MDESEEVGEERKAVVHIFGIEKSQRPLNAMSAANSMRGIRGRGQARWWYVGIGLGGEKV